MTLGLVWLAAGAGALAALVQRVLPRRVDLRPLIFGGMGVAMLLGLMGFLWNAGRVLELQARYPKVLTATWTRDPRMVAAMWASHPKVVAAAGAHHDRALSLFMTGIGLALAVGALGMLAVVVRAVVLRWFAAHRTAAPPPAALPASEA